MSANASAPAALPEADWDAFPVRVAIVAAAVLVVDFFILPWIWWAAIPEGAAIWKSHAMAAVTLASKADLHGLWLIPICALAVLGAALVELRHIKRSTVMMGATVVCGLTLLYFFAVMSAEGRERLRLLPEPATSVQISGWLLLPLACAGGFLYAGWRLRRTGT